MNDRVNETGLLDARGELASDFARQKRQFTKAMTANCTVGEAHAMSQRYANATIEQVAANFPALVMRIVEDYATRNGWPMVPVPDPATPPALAVVPE